MKKVVIGISGGVDSAVAAYLLKEQGYDCIGVTLYLFDYIDEFGNRQVPGFLEDGKLVCDQLGIKHEILDRRQLFEKEVIEAFREGFGKGWIPNPCAKCNPHVKYEVLVDYAEEIGADFVATGHYAKIVKSTSDRYTIERAAAERKDQAYPLSGLTQRQLSKMIWPLGDMLSKDHIRALAKEVGLRIHAKKDSVGICFLEDGNYRRYFDQYYGDTNLGYFKNQCGDILGSHKGTHYYTYGQKRQLGIEGNYTILNIDGKSKDIILGPDEACYHKRLTADDYRGMLWDEPVLNKEIVVKICQWGYELPARVTSFENDILSLEFNEPARAVTPGQRVVFYEDRKTLASARIIERN